MSPPDAVVPVEAAEIHEEFNRDGRRSALRFEGKPYLVFWNGCSWDNRPLREDEILGFEAAEKRWVVERPMAIDRALRGKLYDGD